VVVWNDQGMKTNTTALWLNNVAFWNVADTNTAAFTPCAVVNIYGPIGSSCQINVSTNLTQAWLLQQTVTITTNPTVFIDYSSTNQPLRYYQTKPE